MTAKIAGLVAGLAFLTALPGAASAFASRCSAAEAKAAGKKASCKASVDAAAAARNVAPDPLKLERCEGKFSAAWGKAQAAGDCASPATAGATETEVDDFVNDLIAEIVVGPPEAARCQAAKLKAAGRKASCLLGVDAKGIARGTAPDPVKRQSCIGKFGAAYSKPEARPPCGSPADATTIENKVDAFESEIVSDVTTASTSTTTSTTGTTSSASSSTATTTSSTTTTSGPAVCGNGVVEPGEGCDPPGSPTCPPSSPGGAMLDCLAGCVCPGQTTSSTTVTTTSSTTTTTAACCGFPGQGPTRLSFTTGIGAGNCGTIQLATGAVSKNLTCGGLYTGGGQNTVPLPYAVPDMGQSLTAVSSCNAATGQIGLTNVTSAQTGSNRNCTSVGCLFGPPLPIPNPGSTPTSVCVVNSVSANASGSMNCNTGATAALNLPLTSALFLDGDLLPNRPGIQVCPVCLAGACVGDPPHDGLDCTSDANCGTGRCALGNTCHGGPNDGLACTPADSPVNASFPTTHDCPPPALDDIGSLPIAFNLSTATTSRTAQALSGQAQVFCGYCRDVNAAGSGCFAGDPGSSCPHNATCAGVANPWNCCTGLGAGTCDAQTVAPCTSAAQCSALANGTWPDCQQRDPGAFGPAGGGAHTITETGMAAGALTDGGSHASTLVSIFCVQPTFNATVDAAGDLPGPGAVSLPGMTQLLP